MITKSTNRWRWWWCARYNNLKKTTTLRSSPVVLEPLQHDGTTSSISHILIECLCRAWIHWWGVGRGGRDFQNGGHMLCQDLYLHHILHQGHPSLLTHTHKKRPSPLPPADIYGCTSSHLPGSPFLCVGAGRGLEGWCSAAVLRQTNSRRGDIINPDVPA